MTGSEEDGCAIASTTASAPQSPMANDPISRRISFKSPPSFENLPTDQTPENFVLENFDFRPRSLSHHLSSTKIPSRRWLKIQARWWRSLMRLGMKFHGWSSPKPPKPDFVRMIATDTIPIELLFYVPADYQINYNKESRHRYPMVVNFHGGGFTMGDATDDRYYARVIMKHTKAVFISVNYRRAPEHPFPAAVDDCVEALMYLSSHATELNLDPTKTALSGFSAGGNLSFTVPFRLTYHTNPQRPRLFPGPGSTMPSHDDIPNIIRVPTHASIEAGLNPEVQGEGDINPRAAASTDFLLQKPVIRSDASHESSVAESRSPSPLPQPTGQEDQEEHQPAEPHVDHHVHFAASPIQSPKNEPQDQQQEQHHHHHLFHHRHHGESKPKSKSSRPKTLTRNHTALHEDKPSNLRILSIIAWYPLLDWTSSRSAKVRSSKKPSATLKKTFTDLFDYSYLPPPDDARNHISPYASPGLAPPEMIKDGLPTKIQIWLCEYDMLLAEGEEFVKRLRHLGKDVYHELVEKSPHGWDKSPNPFRDQKKIDTFYIRSATQLQAVFDEAAENPAEFRGERISVGGLR